MIITNEFVIFKTLPENCLSITKNGKQHVWCRVVRHTTGTIVSIEPVIHFVDYDDEQNKLKIDDVVLLNDHKFRVRNLYNNQLEIQTPLFVDVDSLTLSKTMYTITFTKGNKDFQFDLSVNTVTKDLAVTIIGTISNLTEV